MKKLFFIPAILGLIFAVNANATTLFIFGSTNQVPRVLDTAGGDVGIVCQTIQAPGNMVFDKISGYFKVAGGGATNLIMGMSGAYSTADNAYTALQNTAGNIFSSLNSDNGSITADNTIIKVDWTVSSTQMVSQFYYVLCFSPSGGTSSQSSNIYGQEIQNSQNGYGQWIYGSQPNANLPGTPDFAQVYLEISGTLGNLQIGASNVAEIQQTQDYFDSTSTPFYVDCSIYSGDTFLSGDALGCNLKKVGGYIMTGLLVAPQQAKDALNGAIQDARSAPPFSYIYQGIDAVSSSISGVTTTSNGLSLTIPLNIGTNTSTTIIFYNNDTLNNQIGSSTKDLVFNAIKNLMWVAGGVGVIVMFL